MAYGIRTFRGFGSSHRVFVNGQITRGLPIGKARDRALGRNARLRRRVLDALKLAFSPRLPGGRVRITCAGATIETTSDSLGHFSASLDIAHTSVSSPCQCYRVDLLQPFAEESVSCEGSVLVAGPQAQRIIVTDIDDTIIYTGVANKAKMLWRLFGHSAQQRTPFPGIGAFYRALHAGATGDESNPVIYVSRAPWSIYPVLEAFLQLHDFPRLPVLQLREWGITWRHPFPRRARSHKTGLLEQVFQNCPEHRLLLIGDSGQRDPELYEEFARRYPDRIDGIYLRDVSTGAGRTRGLEALKASLAESGIPVVISGETNEMASDAATRGFICSADLVDIHRAGESQAS